MRNGIGLREFVRRRLRHAPVIRPVWDRYERMERELRAALAARDAAIAARDAAVEERNPGLTRPYARAFLRANEAPDDFAAPSHLALGPTAPARSLVIGSCFAEGIAAKSRSNGGDADFILFNFVGELPQQPPRPISEYDFQVIILPLRTVMPENLYMRLNYDDVEAFENLFCDAIERLNQLLHAALPYSREFGKLTFIANFLTPQQNPLGRLLPQSDLRNPAYFCRQLNSELEKIISPMRNVYMLDLDGIAATYGKRWVQDDVIWTFSHGAFLNDWDMDFDKDRLDKVLPLTQQLPSFSDEFCNAIWQEINAMHRIVRQVDSIKIIVVDLDDTLWRGVAADAPSIDASMIEGWPLGFIEALQYARKRGVLLAIISRNERSLIEKLWPNLCGGRIELDDFAAVKIDWRPKVEAMEELLGEVNLLPRSVLFIDDNPLERAAMKAAFPDMRVIGANPYEHRRLILWAPEMQVPVITDESVQRTKTVRAQVAREQSRRRMSREEFLGSLGLTLHVFSLPTLDHPLFARAFELLNKTNQFNTTGRRWTTEEMQQALTAGRKLHAFEVSDTYTRYGLVGVVIMRGTTFEQFVMSCRVVGLDVEQAAVAVLSRQAAADTATRHIRAVTRDTDANLLSRDLWQRCGFERRESSWEAPISAIAAVPAHVDVYAEPAFRAMASSAAT